MSVTDDRTDVRLTTEVVRDGAEFDALADAWAELHAASPAATPFQSHAWLTAWWRHYGTEGALRVAVVRDGARLAAAAPLYLSRRGPWSVLAPLGGKITDFTDLLVRSGPGADAARSALVRALVAEPDWQVLDLPEVRPGSAAESVLGVWCGATTTVPTSVVLELPGVPLEEQLPRLSKNSRKVVRSKLRKTDELGLTVREVPAEEAVAGVDRLLQLHARQWEGRGMNPEHGRARFAGHLRDALPRMIGEGSAALVEYRLDGEVVMCDVNVVGPTMVGAYLGGAAPELREVMDVAVSTMRHDLDFTSGRGIPVFSMLRGGEPYKDRFDPTAVRNSRLLLRHPHRPAGVLYAGLVRGRASAVRLAKQHAPWLRSVADAAGRLTGRRSI